MQQARLRVDPSFDIIDKLKEWRARTRAQIPWLTLMHLRSWPRPQQRFKGIKRRLWAQR